MTKISIDPGRTHDQPLTPVVDGALPPAQRDGNSCDVYAPGHQMHYRHQGDAVRSRSRVVRETVTEDTHLTLTLDDGTQLHWLHHDPARLGRIVELLPGSAVAYPEFHAFRVGPYWFNCADLADGPLECRISATRVRTG